MNGFTRWVALVAVLVIVQGCANNVAPENLRAYAIAAGVLTLCDDGDFDYALEHFGRPLKATAGTDWSDKMQKTRGTYGLPVIRTLVGRDSQKASGAATDSAG